jgi:hypothetical protein
MREERACPSDLVGEVSLVSELAVIELAEKVLDFARPNIGPCIIEGHGAMQAALRRLEPLARLVQAPEEIEGVTEQAREANHPAGLIKGEATARLALLDCAPGKTKPRRQFIEGKVELLAKRFEFSEGEPG